ncbi:MAG: DUF805 domain-containing protein [Pseudomonadota bacterium]
MIRTAYWLFDPRGRVNRYGLIILAAGLLLLQAALGTVLATGLLDVSDPITVAIKAVFFYLAIVAAAKRLHDLNKSAFWILGSAVGIVVMTIAVAALLAFTVGPQQLAPGSTGYVVAVLSTMGPVLVATLWLHAARGDDEANRFGPPPGASGFSDPVNRHGCHLACA